MQENGRPTPNSSTDWRELASRASKESDPRKLTDLVQQLCDRLDEIEQQKKKPAESVGGEMDGRKQEGM